MPCTPPGCCIVCSKPFTRLWQQAWPRSYHISLQQHMLTHYKQRPLILWLHLRFAAAHIGPPLLSAWYRLNTKRLLSCSLASCWLPGGCRPSVLPPFCIWSAQPHPLRPPFSCSPPQAPLGTASPSVPFEERVVVLASRMRAGGERYLYTAEGVGGITKKQLDDATHCLAMRGSWGLQHMACNSWEKALQSDSSKRSFYDVGQRYHSEWTEIDQHSAKQMQPQESSVCMVMVQQWYAAGMACHPGTRTNMQLHKAVGALVANTHALLLSWRQQKQLIAASMPPQAPAGPHARPQHLSNSCCPATSPARLPAVQLRSGSRDSRSLLRPRTAPFHHV